MVYGPDHAPWAVSSDWCFTGRPADGHAWPDRRFDLPGWTIVSQLCRQAGVDSDRGRVALESRKEYDRSHRPGRARRVRRHGHEGLDLPPIRTFQGHVHHRLLIRGLEEHDTVKEWERFPPDR